MPDPDPIESLFLRWQDRRAGGHPVSAADLCGDRPDLIPELEQRIRVAELLLGPRPAAPPPPAAGPPTLPGFDFHHPLGRGASGEVWLATDRTLRQKRAVKVVRRDGPSDALLREGRKMAALPRHPNRVQVYDVPEHDGRYFLVMEYVPGGPLSRMAPMPWERAVRAVADVADGLADVHALGILHRDVKPANVLWDDAKNEALLADFGIAAHRSRASRVVGTAGYLPPELADGPPTEASDLFSLAATLFHLVGGRPPFPTDGVEPSLIAARRGLIRPADALDKLPAAVADLVRAGLDPDPGRRPDLPTFTARLRGAHLQGLADRLLEQSRRAGGGVRLRVEVLTASEADLVFRPVPAGGVLRTGDLLRLEATADADGYLTVLNLGSSGKLAVLFPNPLAPDGRVRAGEAGRLTVKLSPPAGTDRAAVLWTRRPSRLTPAEWRARLEGGSAGRVATRDLEFVVHEAGLAPAGEWTAEVVGITHTGEPGTSVTG